MAFGKNENQTIRLTGLAQSDESALNLGLRLYVACIQLYGFRPYIDGDICLWCYKISSLPKYDVFGWTQWLGEPYVICLDYHAITISFYFGAKFWHSKDESVHSTNGFLAFCRNYGLIVNTYFSSLHGH